MSSDTTFLSFNPEFNPLLGFTLAGGANTTALVALLCLFLAGLAYASFTDIYRGRQTPNWFTHTAIIVGLIAPPLVIDDWKSHYIVAVIVSAFFLAGWWFAGIGFGDVKLYLAITLLFGLPGVFMLAIGHVVAALISGPTSLILSKRGKIESARKAHVPMFPYMVIGVLATLPALDVPAWVVWGGAGALSLAVMWGLIEKRWFPLPTVASFATPLTEGASAVRVRPSQRLMVPNGERTWRSLPDTRRISGGAIDQVVQGILSHGDWKVLHEAGEVRVRLPADGHTPRLDVDVVEILGGYTLTLTPA